MPPNPCQLPPPSRFMLVPVFQQNRTSIQTCNHQNPCFLFAHSQQHYLACAFYTICTNTAAPCRASNPTGCTWVARCTSPLAPLAWGPNRYRPSTLHLPLSTPFVRPCFSLAPTAFHTAVHIMSLHCAPPARTPRGTRALLPTGTLASQTTPNPRTSWLRYLRAPSTTS